MIRKLLSQSATNRLTQNLYSDFWFSSVQVENQETLCVVFNRMFNAQNLTQLIVSHKDDVYTVDTFEKLADDVYQFTLKSPIEDTLIVRGYTADGVETELTGFIPYRVEKDGLDAAQLEYLRDSYPNFEWTPSVHGNTWQCMCSYVNDGGTRCKRCSLSKYDNETLLNLDLERESLYHFFEKHPQEASESVADYVIRVQKDAHVFEKTIRDAYTAYMGDVKEPVIRKETRKYHVKDFLKNGNKKRIWIPLVTTVALIVVFVFGKPFIEVQWGVYLRNQGEYDKAVAYFEQLDNPAQVYETHIARVYDGLMKHDTDGISEGEYWNDNELMDSINIVHNLSESFMAQVDSDAIISRYIEKLASHRQYYAITFLMTLYQGRVDEKVQTYLLEGGKYYFDKEVYQSAIELYSRASMFETPLDAETLEKYYTALSKKLHEEIDTIYTPEENWERRAELINNSYTTYLLFTFYDLYPAYQERLQEDMYETVSLIGPDTYASGGTGELIDRLVNANYKDSVQRFATNRKWIIMASYHNQNTTSGQQSFIFTEGNQVWDLEISRSDDFSILEFNVLQGPTFYSTASTWMSGKNSEHYSDYGMSYFEDVFEMRDKERDLLTVVFTGMEQVTLSVSIRVGE